MNIFEELEEWRRERGLHQVKSNAIITIKHMLIELTEALEAVHNDDFDGVIDGINDAIVYGVNGQEQMGVNAEKAMEETLKEIHSRKGYYDVKEQKFMKNITGNEYKANYTNALRGSEVGGQSTAYDETATYGSDT